MYAGWYWQKNGLNTLADRGDLGEPYFQIKEKLRRHGIVAFSSNYALYGDVSERVRTLIERLVPALEVYSIDEAFADLSGNGRARRDKWEMGQGDAAFSCSTGRSGWAMRRDLISQCYTTCIDQLWTVKCK